jgi:hypothetical protein
MRGEMGCPRGVSFGILLLLILGAIPLSAQQSSTGSGSVYLYNVSVTTNSDWTIVNFTGGPQVLTLNTTVVQGAQAPGLSYHAQPGLITVNKRSMDNTNVSVRVQMLGLAGTSSGSVSISKGNIGSTNVTLAVYRSGAFQTFLSVGDTGVIGGLNTRSFTVDYSQLYANPSDTTSMQPVPPNFTHKILAFYYPWYGNPAGPSGQWYHWVGVTQSLILSATDYPLFGAYDSQDPTIIEAQMLMAREAGIDGFVSSWWGIGSFEDHSF